MGFVTKKFFLKKRKKVYKFLMDELNLNMNNAQKFVDKKRVLQNGVLIANKTAWIENEIEVIVFEADPIGLQPIFETVDFAIFDKPSGMLVHPRKRSDVQTLNDEIKYLYGVNANAAHRIDRETSGLVLVSKNKRAEVKLKKLFEDNKVQKEYLALVYGYVKNTLNINEKLLVDSEDSLIRIKVHVKESGKDSQTFIEPILYDKKNNVTLIKAFPKTGRQHQIRVHMFHVKHSIVGDMIYGIDEKITDEFLSGSVDEKQRLEICGAKRLLLHSCRISFEYENEKYDIISSRDIQKEFYANCDFG